MQNDGTAYLGHDPTVQPCGDDPQCWYRVHTPKRQCGQIKFEPISVSPMKMNGNAYLACAHAAQPHGSHPKSSYRVFGPKRRRGRLKIVPTNINQTRKEWNTHLGLCKPTKPLPRNPGDPTQSTSIGGLLNSLQNLKNDLQNVSGNDNKPIASSTHLSANGSTTHNAFIANT